MKYIRFCRTVLVPDARVRIESAGKRGAIWGPRTFAAESIVPIEEIHPGCLDSLLRVGHAVGLTDAEAAAYEAERKATRKDQAPAPPAKPEEK
jgi:hypothetical protein